VLIDQADAALRAQGVRNPAAFANVFAPWFPGESGKTETSYGGAWATPPERS
jgi:hypothetical protein